MSMQLSPQAAEFLGKSELVIITERVDDVALLIGQMVKMGLPEVLDRPIPRHGTQRGIRWGWTAVMWLHGRRPPQRVDGNLPQGHAPHPEPPDRTGHRAAGCA